MGREVERKWLVTGPVPEAVVTARARRLRQGYLAVDGPTEVRVRDDDGWCTLTVKSGAGLVRTEVEVAIEPSQFASLWPLTAGRRVEKLRRRVPLDGGTVVEVDTFEGALAGLVVAEAEFPDPGAAGAFTPPPWCGDEVTGHAGWSNAQLARHGRPSR